MEKKEKSDTGSEAHLKEINDPRIKTYQRRLRRLATELSLAEARERRAIASDLHDNIGQALAYVAQKVTVLQGNAIFSGMEEDFTEILRILDQTIKYTRNLTVEISPPVLYELGFSAAIDWLAERMEALYNIKIMAFHNGPPHELSEDVKVFMFKAVKELVFNSVKHAEADEIRIFVEWEEVALKIIVEDDGRGFGKDFNNSELTDDCCFGLFSIRERLSYIGGRMTIDSSTDKGARVSAAAPYHLDRVGK